MQCKHLVRHTINRKSIEITLLHFEDFFSEGVPYLRWEDGIHFTPPTELCWLPSISCCPTSISSAAAAFRFIVILLPDPAYITEYIEDPFDTVRIAVVSVQHTNISKSYAIRLIVICVQIQNRLWNNPYNRLFLQTRQDRSWRVSSLREHYFNNLHVHIKM